jgi:hypothetical protein
MLIALLFMGFTAMGQTHPEDIVDYKIQTVKQVSTDICRLSPICYRHLTAEPTCNFRLSDTEKMKKSFPWNWSIPATGDRIPSTRKN